IRAPKMGCSPPPGFDGRAAQRAAFREWVLRGSGGALPAILEDYPPKRTQISHSTKLACRTDNPYGKRVVELEEVMKNLDEIEPLLRKRATHEIVTTQPIDAVVEAILDISCSSTHCRRRAKTRAADQ